MILSAKPREQRRYRARLVGILLVLSAVNLSAQTDGNERNDTWTLDAIVVTENADSLATTVASTATRTATPVERVPQSIQVLNRTLLEEQALQNVSEALVNVSGVVPSSTAESVLQSPLVRGFPVNYFIDGLPTYGLPSAAIDPATLIQVDRIEVAKGPVNTLYGGGAGAPLSGLLNLVSRDTLTESALSLGLRGGSFGSLSADLDANLAGSSVALRVLGSFEEFDSHIDEVDGERQALFPVVTAQLSDDTRLLLRGHYTRLRQREYVGLPAELTITAEQAIERDRFAGAVDAPLTDIENQMLTASLQHRLSPESTLQLDLRRQQSRFDEYSTFPILPLGGTVYAFASGYLPSNVDKNFLSATLDYRWTGERSSHRFLVGVDADRTDYVGGLGLNLAWGLVDYADPSTTLPYGSAPVPSDTQRDQLDSWALFVQDQISLGERLDLTAGLRWTRLDLRSQYDSLGLLLIDSAERHQELTPRLGLSYRVGQGVSLFAGHARGFQGVVAAFGVENPVPETSIANEVGLKFSQTELGLSGTLALYHLRRRNVVTADPQSPGLSIQTGEQRAQGMELDLIYEPAPTWSVLFSYGYTDAEVSRDNRLPVGDRLSRVPRHSARLAGRYRIRNGSWRGLELGLGLSAVSERELTLPNTVAVGGRALWDAQLSYAIGRATVGLSLRNLTDRDSFEPYQYLGAAIVVPTAPRSAYLSLGFDL